MLAKIVRNGDAGVKPVDWPVVESESAAPGYFASARNSAKSSADLMKLQAELASVSAELSKAKADSDRRAQEAFVTGKREGDGHFPA